MYILNWNSDTDFLPKFMTIKLLPILKYGPSKIYGYHLEKDKYDILMCSQEEYKIHAKITGKELTPALMIHQATDFLRDQLGVHVYTMINVELAKTDGWVYTWVLQTEKERIVCKPPYGSEKSAMTTGVFEAMKYLGVSLDWKDY